MSQRTYVVVWGVVVGVDVSWSHVPSDEETIKEVKQYKVISQCKVLILSEAFPDDSLKRV